MIFNKRQRHRSHHLGSQVGYTRSIGYSSDSSDRGRERAYDSHVNWIPVAPTSTRKFTKVSGGLGRGSRLPSFVNMHYLTAALRSLEPRIDDDFVDRLNYYYTPSIIIIFAILVSAKQYVGHPIECWVPAQFTKAMEQYTENYCWVQNTYWLPFSELIPTRVEDREVRQIGYYQWVPFIFAAQALMFYLPAMLWRLLCTQSGINVQAILQMACDDNNLDPDNRLRTVHVLSRHIDDALRHQRDLQHKSLYLWALLRVGKRYGAYVSALYCAIKVLYFLNVAGQFILLNRFLETSEYSLFGANVVWDLLHGQDWGVSGKFPRVTLCDFEIRVLGNVHRHSVQCVLVINLFTEKIFVFLWLWFLAMSLVSAVSAVYWIASLGASGFRVTYTRQQLEFGDPLALQVTETQELGLEPVPEMVTDPARFRSFVLNFLRPDGVFILRMLGWHASDVMCSEVTQLLWVKYRDNKAIRPLLGDRSCYTRCSQAFPQMGDFLHDTQEKQQLQHCHYHGHQNFAPGGKGFPFQQHSLPFGQRGSLENMQDPTGWGYSEPQTTSRTTSRLTKQPGKLKKLMSPTLVKHSSMFTPPCFRSAASVDSQHKPHHKMRRSGKRAPAPKPPTDNGQTDNEDTPSSKGQMSASTSGVGKKPTKFPRCPTSSMRRRLKDITGSLTPQISTSTKENIVEGEHSDSNVTVTLAASVTSVAAGKDSPMSVVDSAINTKRSKDDNIILDAGRLVSARESPISSHGAEKNNDGCSKENFSINSGNTAEGHHGQNCELNPVEHSRPKTRLKTTTHHSQSPPPDRVSSSKNNNSSERLQVSSPKHSMEEPDFAPDTPTLAISALNSPDSPLPPPPPYQSDMASPSKTRPQLTDTRQFALDFGTDSDPES